jgi:thiamine pyrophosphate-dependent acetolactate synthase large subunit-like protein
MTEHRNGGSAVVQILAAHGVDTVFGIPGTHNLELYRHLPTTGIRAITPRHEQGAGYAAEAYARVTGRPGVVVTTSGPGLTKRDDRGLDRLRGIATDAGAFVGPVHWDRGP